ncbi:hypothetical protein QEJ61_gp17 [Curtobacterium phage Pize]|nr:hypothetical protein QEJ61_gp17 [Curtobacterium phage Pize]QXG07749.1 hypothetical protein [Curtobacterium phage Pize]
MLVIMNTRGKTVVGLVTLGALYVAVFAAAMGWIHVG